MGRRKQQSNDLGRLLIMRFSSQELDKRDIRSFFGTKEGNDLARKGARPDVVLSDMYQARALMGFMRGLMGHDTVNQALAEAKDMKEKAHWNNDLKGFVQGRSRFLSNSLRGSEHASLVSRMVAYDNAMLSASKGSIHTIDDFPIAFGTLCNKYLDPQDCEMSTNWLDWLDGALDIVECNEGVATAYDFSLDSDFRCHKKGDDLDYAVITEEGSKFSYELCHLRQGLKFGSKIRNCADAEQLGRMAELLGNGVRDAVNQAVFEVIDRNTVRYATGVCGYLTREKITEIIQEIMCNEECCDLNSAIYSRNHLHFPEELQPLRDASGRIIRGNPASIIENLYPESMVNKYLDGDWLLFGEQFLVGAVGARQMRSQNSRMYRPLISFKSPTREQNQFLGDFNDCTFSMAVDLEIGFGVKPKACLIRVEGCNPCPTTPEIGCV